MKEGGKVSGSISSLVQLLVPTNTKIFYIDMKLQQQIYQYYCPVSCSASSHNSLSIWFDK